MSETSFPPASSMPRVHLLPPELCNQIAAGEVVERPASAVKELVENALDAGATRIAIDLEEGGRTLIRVTDNGHGMSRQDAELALERHATSKIATLDDLMSIRTLGFRGEALPSIASVSRMTLVTQPHDAMVGTRIVVEGGHIVEKADAASAPGTRIEVRDLFYNTPARLKFLKRVPTELRRVQMTLQRIALMWYGVQFRFTHKGRKRLDVAGHESFSDRLLAVLGREAHTGLYPIPELSDVGGVTATGYFSAPSLTARGTGSQYTFVNGRYIQDRTIQAAIKAAYRELIPNGRAPVVAVMLDVPPELVDVNVHPTKVEVRFQDTDAIFRAVFRGLRDGLARTPWTGQDETPGIRTTLAPTRLAHGDPGPYAPGRRLGGDETSLQSGPPAAQKHLRGLYGEHTESAPAWVSKLFGGGPAPGLIPAGEGSEEHGDDGVCGGYDSDALGGDQYFSRLRYIGQLARMYLLTTDGAGLVVVDQHAAHERISFERLKGAWRDRAPEYQQLLFPVQLELDALRAATLEEHLEFFHSVGFEIEPFGGTVFAIKTVPGILAGARYIQVVRDAIDDLSHVERTSRFDEALESVLSRMACHGSVRAGDDLTAEEAYALFAQMDQIDFRAHCPHGRPVSFKISLEELEKRFERR